MAEIPPPTAAAVAAAPPGPVVRRRPLWRRLLRVGVWSGVVLLLLIAGLAFVASRTVTLQWAAQQAVRLADGRLQIEGITGSVLTGISADSVQWQDGSVSVAITSPRFTYHPFAMLDGLFRIESISAADVEVDLPSAPAPAGQRTSFRLPPAMASLLPVAIERLDLGRLIVRRAGGELARLHNLELLFRHDGDRMSARLLNLDVMAGDKRIGIRGDAAVLARSPYATDGRLSVMLPMQPRPLRLDVRINGPIEELAVRAGTVVAGAAVDARAVVHIFEPRPLRQVRLDVKDLDLSRYDPALPVTGLTGTYVAEVMPVWASERRPLLIGPLNLINALAAPLDRNRLPVTRVKAVVGYVDGGLEVQGLQASGLIGEITGDGRLRKDSLRLALSSDRLNLQALDSTSGRRSFVAKITVEPDGAAGAPASGSPGVADPAAGPLRVHATAADASVAAELKAVIVRWPQMEISLAQVQLKDGTPEGAGRASFLGSVGLAAPWPVDLSGDLRHVNLAQLAAKRPALLNGTWRIAGRLSGSGDGDGLLQAYLSLDESRFRGLPLAGRLAATLALEKRQLQQLSAVHGDLRWGSGTLEASGALGGAADVLRLTVNLPDLGEVQQGTAGAVSGHVNLGGSLAAPSLEARLDGEQLVATAGGARTRIARAGLRLKAANLSSGGLRAQADLAGVEVGPAGGDRNRAGSAGRLSLGVLEAVVEGSRADHRVEVDAAGEGQRLVLAARGGIGDDRLWRGVVHRLAASHPLLETFGAAGSAATAAAGPVPAREAQSQAALNSLQPFRLVAGGGRFTARDARFGLHGARLNLRQADWQAPVLALTADASGLGTGWLGRFAKLAAPSQDMTQALTVSAAVEFAGNLDHKDAAGWRGRLRLEREAGDLILAGPGGADPAPAGLRTLQAGLSLHDRNLDLVVNAHGEHIGRMAAEVRTTLQPGSEPAWAAASMARSPLAGRLDLAVNSFRWLPSLVDGSWRVDGALGARLQLAGTLGDPRAEGAVTGSNLSAEEQTLGMRLSNGLLAAELVDGRVEVKLLRFESGAGSVAVSGLLQPAGAGRSRTRVVVDRLPLPLGIGQRVVLSGSTTATLSAHGLDLTGRLVADDGLVEIKSGSLPTGLGVVAAAYDAGTPVLPAPHGLPNAVARPVVSRSAPPPGSHPTAGIGPAESAGGAGAVAARSFGIDTDLEVDLGRRFRVVGSGLDANLTGAVRLHGHYPMSLRATGTVDLTNGTYRANRRQLRIKHGRIVFDGLLDDPDLDIVAVRDNLKIEPGLQIGGSAVSPVAGLVSVPDVPDADKLAWLVLGGSLADTRSAGQMRALQRAATALFGAEAAADVAGSDGKPGSGPSMRARDKVVVIAPGDPPGDAPGPVAMVGQRLASRLSATYGQSLRGVWNILKLQYEITDRLSLSAQKAGSDSGRSWSGGSGSNE